MNDQGCYIRHTRIYAYIRIRVYTAKFSRIGLYTAVTEPLHDIYIWEHLLQTQLLQDLSPEQVLVLLRQHVCLPLASLAHLLQPQPHMRHDDLAGVLW